MIHKTRFKNFSKSINLIQFSSKVILRVLHRTEKGAMGKIYGRNGNSVTFDRFLGFLWKGYARWKRNDRIYICCGHRTHSLPPEDIFCYKSKWILGIYTSEMISWCLAVLIFFFSIYSIMRFGYWRRAGINACLGSRVCCGVQDRNAFHFTTKMTKSTKWWPCQFG